MKRTVLVIGATGNQGNSVVRHLIKDRGFVVRALVRKLDSVKAKELLDLGVHLVRGDLEDVNSLVNAMSGCGEKYECC